MIDQGPPNKSNTADHGLQKRKGKCEENSCLIRDLPLEIESGCTDFLTKSLHENCNDAWVNKIVIGKTWGKELIV